MRATPGRIVGAMHGLLVVAACSGSPEDSRDPGTIVVGHRGNPVVATENTLTGVLAAFEAGAAMVEVDIHLSRDSVPFLFHDDSLEATTLGTGLAADQTWAQLQQVLAGSRRDETAREKIPSLESVLLALPAGGRILLDIKSSGVARRVAEITRRIGFQRERIAVGVWDYAQAAEFTAELPEALLFLATGTPPTTEAYFADLRAHGIEGIEVGGVPSADFVQAAHRHGLLVFAYTINDEVRILQLARLGVDGIETDVPGFAAHLIREHARDR